jgi:hypothetical protein
MLRLCCQDRLKVYSQYTGVWLCLSIKGEHMQGNTPFHLLPLTDFPHLAPRVTDTARPQQHIPIYFIHSLEQPFCTNPKCKCQWQQKEVRRLLGSILEGEITLRQAANLLDEVSNEGERQ